METKNQEQQDAELKVDESHSEESSANEGVSVEENNLSQEEKLSAEVVELKEKYLRLYSDFENFRKRTAKERIDLIKTASEEVLKDLVPVVDDFERALKNIEKNDENAPLFEGVELAASRNIRASELAALPLKQRLERRIIDSEKVGLTDDLDTAMAEGIKPLAIINDHLLEGMKEVGELFGKGEMQLPFVLQSAEVMKSAVAYLEPHMEKKGEGKGTLVLATVKGDVHDIGKNLVDIILSNNGYRVVNLGIKVPIEEILKAVEAHKPHAVGMSGLLVKSTLVMKENLEYMRDRGYTLPVILGGAALTRSYVEELRAIYPNVYYAEDAFEGLRLMEELTGHAPPELTRKAPARPKREAPKVAPRARPVGEAPAVPGPPSSACGWRKAWTSPPSPTTSTSSPSTGASGATAARGFPGRRGRPWWSGRRSPSSRGSSRRPWRKGGLNPRSSTASSPWPGRGRSFSSSPQRRGRCWNASASPGRRAGA